jgi:hypothetical protein
MRRFPIALVLVGVLALLVAGGAVLGAFQAPTGNDLTVHNGAGETLLADHVVGHYTNNNLHGVVVSFDFQAPDHLSEVARGPKGKVKGRRTVSGATALAILDPIRQLLTLGTFSPHPGFYENVQPASVLAPASTRGRISGTYRTRVQLAGGFVVGVSLRIDATDGSQHVKESVEYHLTRVAGWSGAG